MKPSTLLSNFTRFYSCDETCYRMWVLYSRRSVRWLFARCVAGRWIPCLSAFQTSASLGNCAGGSSLCRSYCFLPVFCCLLPATRTANLLPCLRRAAGGRAPTHAHRSHCAASRRRRPRADHCLLPRAAGGLATTTDLLPRAAQSDVRALCTRRRRLASAPRIRLAVAHSTSDSKRAVGIR